MDKIYSRRRIKLPKIKKVNYKKIFFIVLLFFILVSLFFSSKAVYDVFDNICRSEASGMATTIVSNEIKKIICNYEYEDFINIEKDTNEKITIAKTNVITINEIMSNVTYNIQQELDNLKGKKIYIKLGSFSGVKMFSGFGPNVGVEIVPTGNIISKLETEFVSVRS